MEMETRVQILDKAVCVSLCVNVLKKVEKSRRKTLNSNLVLYIAVDREGE